MNLQKNQILSVRIAETNMLGFGVVKIDGVVIFVQNAVEEDFCKIKIIKRAKNYCVARIEELIEPSSKRIEPTCLHFRRCGGCSFQHVSYEYEKQLKLKSVEGFLLKEGLKDVAVLPVLSTGNTENYRNKAQFPVSLDENGDVICGFYANKTHKVCRLDSCSIQNSRFNTIAKCVCSFLTENRIPPYNEETQNGLVRHIYLRAAEQTGQIMLCLVLSTDEFHLKEEFISVLTKKFPEITSICLNIQPENTNVILGNKMIYLFGPKKNHGSLLR